MAATGFRAKMLGLAGGSVAIPWSKSLFSRKDFFFEKKKQKTFTFRPVHRGQAMAGEFAPAQT
jgi:hypothetical protein